MIKRIALNVIAASIILVGVAPAAQSGIAPADDSTVGNFVPTVELDRSQVMNGEQAIATLEVFCFDSLTDTGWICYTAADIPDEYAANNYERVVWRGPTNEIQDAYERLG